MNISCGLSLSTFGKFVPSIHPFFYKDYIVILSFLIVAIILVPLTMEYGPQNTSKDSKKKKKKKKFQSQKKTQKTPNLGVLVIYYNPDNTGEDFAFLVKDENGWIPFYDNVQYQTVYNKLNGFWGIPVNVSFTDSGGFWHHASYHKPHLRAIPSGKIITHREVYRDYPSCDWVIKDVSAHYAEN